MASLCHLYLLVKYSSSCVVTEWSKWGNCPFSCSIDERVRTRTKKRSNIFDTDPEFQKSCPLVDKEPCGSPNNGCEKFCEAGKCLCPTGYKLGSDEKSCLDVNECIPNDGLGSCSQICKNTKGSYYCSCYKGFSLGLDGHDCVTSATCPADFHHYENGICVCKNKLTGLKCDRNVSLCNNNNVCQTNDLCLTFISAARRCFGSKYQIPVLLPVAYRALTSGIFHLKVEGYVESILIGNTNGNTMKTLTGHTQRKKRDLNSVYVEGSKPVKIKAAHTYIHYLALDPQNNFKAFHAKRLCKMFETSDIRCLNEDDCKLLKSVGITCPFVHVPTPQKQSSYNESAGKPWMYAIIFGMILISIICILLFVYIKRKRSKKYSNVRFNRDSSGIEYTDNGRPLLNSDFDSVPQHGMALQLNNENLNQQTNMPDNLRQRSDVTFFENNIFTSKPNSDKEEKNLMYGQDDIEIEKDAPIYESIENLTGKSDQYVDMNDLSKDSCCSDGLVVNLPDQEPRYAQPPSRITTENITDEMDV